MQREELVLRQYEDSILSGKFTYTRSSYLLGDMAMDYKSMNEEQRKERNKANRLIRHEDALCVFRYALSSLSGLEVRDLPEFVSWELIEQLKLDRYFRMIIFPRRHMMSEEEKLRYLCHLCFPKEISFDKEKSLNALYKKILNNELDRFPKGSFTTPGSERILCKFLLQYIQYHYELRSPSDYYALASTTARLNALLEGSKLRYSYRECYDSPLEFVHEALGIYGDDFYYQVCKIDLAMEKERRREKMKGRKYDWI